MPIAKTISSPEWVDSGSELTGGLDLLGLRLPVQTIGGSLLNGVTTVTPSIRYIAFRSWLIYRYGESRRPDSWTAFTDFSGYVECALVLGNLIQKPSLNGLIGTDEALERMGAQTPLLGISPLVKTPASTVYAGPSEQLGVSAPRDDKVPGISDPRGKRLALAVDQHLSKISLVEQLFGKNPPDEVSREALAELGAAARIDQIPDGERETLIQVVLPTAPRLDERARSSTYAALLALAKEKGALPTEKDIFSAACSLKRFGEPVLDHAADGWLTYCVRDAIAVSHEAVLAAVVNEMGPEDGRLGVESSRVIGELLARVDEHDNPLRALNLLEAGESVWDMTFRELYARIEERLSIGYSPKYGISRWGTALDEPTIYNLALNSGAGAVSLAVVTWIVAAIRVGAGVRENLTDFGNLSYQGWRRMGLRDVVLPEIDRLLQDNPPLTTVAAELTHRVVQQHLQIAWSRLQVDFQRDVALVTAEGNRWFSRGKGYSGGRTLSRLREALGWLAQLKLVDGNGATPDGGDILARTLQTLSGSAA